MVSCQQMLQVSSCTEGRDDSKPTILMKNVACHISKVIAGYVPFKSKQFADSLDP